MPSLPSTPSLTVLPALRPLVVHLFLRTPASMYTQVKLLNAAREMVIEKMLRIIPYEGTMNLFTSILVCRESGDVKPRLARQTLAALLPHLRKQQVHFMRAWGAVTPTLGSARRVHTVGLVCSYVRMYVHT